MRGERTNHHRTGNTKRLLGGPQRVIALVGARHDQRGKIEPELRKPGRIRRALLGEGALLASPNNSSRTGPLRRQRQRQAQRRRLRAWRSRTQFM